MRIAGHCVVSGEPCFEILETYPSHHVLAGQPRRLGNPLPGALRVTLILVDGRQATVSVLRQHLPDLVLHLPKAWDEIRQLYRLTRKAHHELGQPDFDDAQHSIADAVNIDFNDNVPLGVLCYEELHHG